MTQVPGGPPPAGWYPDPTPPQSGGPPLLRWWDGTRWTAHVETVPGAVPAWAGPAPARPQGPTTPDGQPLAGWWQRVAASVLDSLILGLPANLLTLPWQLRMQLDLQDLVDEPLSADEFLDGLVGILQSNLPAFLVPSLLGLAYMGVLLRWKGATVGKMALGIAVRLREQPGQLPWSAIAIRLIVYPALTTVLMLIALFSGSLALGLTLLLVALLLSWADVLLPLVDPKRQAIHDKLAGTNVVRTRR